MQNTLRLTLALILASGCAPKQTPSPPLPTTVEPPKPVVQISKAIWDWPDDLQLRVTRKGLYQVDETTALTDFASYVMDFARENPSMTETLSLGSVVLASRAGQPPAEGAFWQYHPSLVMSQGGAAADIQNLDSQMEAALKDFRYKKIRKAIREHYADKRLTAAFRWHWNILVGAWPGKELGGVIEKEVPASMSPQGKAGNARYEISSVVPCPDSDDACFEMKVGFWELGELRFESTLIAAQKTLLPYSLQSKEVFGEFQINTFEYRFEILN